eukprot:TRINITY_DN1684_c0_g1_i5.p1 TRINITY_DN1684_c0_g1~~TRINITY_DN1684_c0_g1_i5.p1  ORF type:complete len:253 (+),score=75.96 TRINITY_DN1684_c0_g1_i5:1-759(+)
MCISVFFFSSRRRHTRQESVSWARRCVQETGYQRRVHGGSFAQQRKILFKDLSSISKNMIQFILMVNKQGQTRLAQYYNFLTVKERTTLEGELIRKCLSRTETQCSFVEHRQYKVVYRRYASLFFIVGLDSDDENELAYLEFIHNLVETLDKYFENVCELDIMFNIEKAHYMLDEMVMNGFIVETNKSLVLAPIQALDKSGSSQEILSLNFEVLYLNIRACFILRCFCCALVSGSPCCIYNVALILVPYTIL